MKSERILVVTSTKGFGQLIQQTLEESGYYLVTLNDNVQDALHSVHEGSYILAILDASIKGGSLDVIAQEMRIEHPGLKLIIIPPDNDIQSPIMEKVAPEGYLTKPFYLPDLFDTIKEVLGINPSQTSGEISSGGNLRDRLNPSQSLDWLEDVNLAAQHLTRLSLESAAHAALIVRENQLWAYAGHLADPAAEELVSIVNDFWQNDKGDAGSSGDKVRFIRLKTTGMEYLLYVTAIGDGMVLALAFDTETPFSKIRTQAAKLARSLASPPNHISGMANTNWSSEGQWAQETEHISPHPTINIKSLLGEIPTPNPDVVSARPTFQDEESYNKPLLTEIKTAPDAYSQLDLTTESVETTEANKVNPYNRKDTAKTLKSEDLRPVSPAMHYLNFACLLIPRIPKQHLTGELASSLGEWMYQLCLAYGWRLEHQSIRPGYLLWIASVSPSTSPSTHIRIIRKQTSLRIFEAFPNFQKDNPSGDYWAPGYLIVSSSQPPAADIINQFIFNSRQHQGL